MYGGTHKTILPTPTPTYELSCSSGTDAEYGVLGY